MFKKVIIKKSMGLKLDKNCHFRVEKQKTPMYPTDLTQTEWQFIKKALDFDDKKQKNLSKFINDGL